MSRCTSPTVWAAAALVSVLMFPESGRSQESRPTRPATGFYLGFVSETGLGKPAETIHVQEGESSRYGVTWGLWSVGLSDKHAKKSMAKYPPGSIEPSVRAFGVEFGRLLANRRLFQPALFATVGAIHFDHYAGHKSAEMVELLGSVGVPLWIFRFDMRAGVRFSGELQIGEQSVNRAVVLLGATSSIGKPGDWRWRR